MVSPANRPVALRSAALLISVLAAALGAAVLAGWALDIAFLKSIQPGGVTMKSNTALSMLLCGLALVLLSRKDAGKWARRYATATACVLIAFGALTLTEAFLGWNLGIDQWLFSEAHGAPETTSPGRMSPPAAFCFVLTGIALLLAARPFAARFRSPVISALSITVILVGGLALLGHLMLLWFDIHFWNYAGLALHTSAGLLLIGCALLAWVRAEHRPDWSLDGVTTAGFAVGIVSILAAAGISYSFTDQLRQDSRWVTRAEETLKEIQELNSSQRDLTLSLGRYLITHEEGAVARRPDIEAAIEEDINHVLRLTADNPGQQSRLQELERLTARRIALQDEIIAKIRQQTLAGGAQSAARGGASPLGEEYPALGLETDHVLEAMEAEEYAVLHERQAVSESSSSRTFLLMPVGVYLSIAILLLGLFFLNSVTAARRRAEEARMESETYFHTIFEAAPDGMIIADRSGRILIANPAAEKMFGDAGTLLSGTAMNDLVPAAKREALRRDWDELTRDSAATVAGTREVEGVRHDGSVFPIELMRSAFETPGGLQVLGVVRDISERKQVELTRARLAAIVEASDDAIISKTLDGAVTTWNAGAERLFGYAGAEMVGRSITLIIPQDRLHEEELIVSQIALGETVRHYETVRQHKDGTLLDISVTVSPIRDAAGVIVGASKIARDITERKRADNKIRRLNRVYAVLSGINTLIVRVRDRETLFREACDIAVEEGQFQLAWIGMVDRDTQNIEPAAWAGDEQGRLTLGRTITAEARSRGFGLATKAIATRKYVVSNDIESDSELMGYPQEALARGYRSAIAMPLIVDNEAIGVLHLYAGEPHFFDEEEMLLLLEMAGDISFALHHIRQSEHLDYLAYYDELTGLANSTLFRERIGQLVSGAGRDTKQFAVVLLNVERFKIINDTLGRNAGDDLLKQIAERARCAIADSNWLARIGGDHFAMLLPEVTGAEDAARQAALRYKEIFDAPFDAGETELRVAARSGIAMFPADGTDVDTLFRNAESALKSTKASGERYMFYTLQMTARVAERLSLENKLRRALEKDEFILHYQPKVSLATGAITGVEALIRWNDPATGLVPPAQFIALLEETGLILEVGSWALTQAVRDHGHWRGRGLPAPRIAVNVSPIQLRQRDFVEIVWRAIAAGALPAGIDLEITESVIMDDVDANIAKLIALREMGITIFIDDFGTGYSSLGYLARLPVQSLKIDRSFVITMLEDSNAMTLVSTIISLAHSLNLKVVAEGVDREEQAQTLRLLRCEEMQGYLFSKPLPRDQLTVLLAREAG
jgi:PAS domain S-box-containing protein/diguanylate cyclase (GGDEF)-like protein